MSTIGQRTRRMVCASVTVMSLAVVCVPGVVGVASAKPSSKPFEIVPGSFHVVPSTVQAGAHEDLTTSFDFAHNVSGETFNDVRTIVTELPAGLTGNSTAVPTCTFGQLLAGELLSGCPPDTQVGTISFSLGSVYTKMSVPLDNMLVTTPGIAAEFGFKTPVLTQVLTVQARPGDLGLTVTSPNIPLIGEAHNIKVTVWGVPAAHVHDPERNLVCLAGPPYGGGEVCYGGNQPVSIQPKPYLAMPTSCSGVPLTARLRADSWENPEQWREASTQIGPITECERVPFEASIEAQPTTNLAESSSGLDVSLVVPQTWENPGTIASSNLKDTTVALPVGYTVNPSEGSGLAGCTPEQYAAETPSNPPGTGCPPESKLGTVEIETPVLAQKIDGNIYLAQPYDNPFSEPGHPGGSLIALYVVAKEPQVGVIVKAAGKVQANPLTGQLVSTFENTPQQPFSRFKIKFRQGAASPLVSPPACGTYTILAALTPWSAPEEPHALSSSFQIEHGIGGGPCPAGGTPPFHPRVISGTEDNNAGNYTPFYLRINREDGEQEITKFTTVLPPGLTANLTGIPFCSDAQIQAAREHTGQQELHEPACPAASEIGHTLVGAGVGSVLAWTPGKLYLAGSYHGSFLSLVSVTSATVGPFDLGTVVIRFALRINPVTAQAEIDSTGSDPIPHIIDGIVVHVRDIHVYVDRPHFMIDPTSCEPLQINETITGAGADPSNPAGQQTVPVDARFQAADCQNLKFKPVFQVFTSGKTSRKTGASLHVKLTYPNQPQGTQANIHYVKVDLPKQLPSNLPTLKKACLAATFDQNPAACPPASRVGTAKAITPILPVPLEGPAYFVSYGGAKFPELIVVLQGYGVTIDLHGETFIDKAGITSSTFKNVPDEPVTSFELTLPQGPYSALAAPGGKLCTSTLRMPTTFTAQNGMQIHQSTPITATGCARHKQKHHAKKNHKHKSNHKSTKTKKSNKR